MPYNHIENNPIFTGLSVSEGVSGAPALNPYFKTKKRKDLLPVEVYYDGIVAGDVSILGQAVTLIESALPEHQAVAQQLLERCLPLAGNSVRLGITGVPGAGKSSLIEVLGMYLIRQKRKLAVLAIDPSSERSKGSILGDKTRMQELSSSPDAFIRPSPAAGSLGGVARKTRETIVLCEAAGFDTVFVETVGVGQSEIAVHSMVDFFLLIQITGTGDELQGIKRGIMEMADGIAINKSDGTNLEKSMAARTLFQNALHLFPAAESGWTAEVINCSALANTGIDALWDMVERYLAFTEQNGYFQHKRKEQSKYWMYEFINEHLKSNFYNNSLIENKLKEMEQQVVNRQISSFAAAQELLDEYFKK